MIKIKGLSKFFRTEEVETIALNKVSLNILKRMNMRLCTNRRKIASIQ